VIIQCAQAVVDGELITDCWLSVENEVITDIQEGIHPNPDQIIAGTLIPAFVDIHSHGGGGSYFSDADPMKAVEFHRAHGTGTIVASLVSEPLDELKRQISNLVPLYHAGVIAGIHLEGPYLAHARCGAHRPENLINPRWEDLSELLEIGEGSIVMVTIAPELDGALECIGKLTDHGVIAAIGHTAASLETMESAIDAGAEVVTHFSNGMVKPSGNRTLTDALLDEEQLSMELILDGEHVSAEIVEELLAIDPLRLILVTDAMSAAGQPDGEYKIGALPVHVRNGVARLENGSLAGSTLTMDAAFTRLVKEYGVTLVDAVDASSGNAARALGMEDRGVIAVGAVAEFLEWDGKNIRRNETLQN
jgi:N-acetylglucosamine-6-phosphate deacetylase